MASLVTPRITVWASSTTETFFPATGWLRTEAWRMLRWQYEFNSCSGANFRVSPAFQFSNDGTNLKSPVSFSNGGFVLPAEEWEYADDYINLSSVGTSGIGAFVRFGFLTKLSTGTDLTYARLRFAADGRT